VDRHGGDRGVPHERPASSTAVGLTPFSGDARVYSSPAHGSHVGRWRGWPADRRAGIRRPLVLRKSTARSRSRCTRWAWRTSSVDGRTSNT
jgi:hypothetical protein